MMQGGQRPPPSRLSSTLCVEGNLSQKKTGAYVWVGKIQQRPPSRSMESAASENRLRLISECVFGHSPIHLIPCHQEFHCWIPYWTFAFQVAPDEKRRSICEVICPFFDTDISPMGGGDTSPTRSCSRNLLEHHPRFSMRIPQEQLGTFKQPDDDKYDMTIRKSSATNYLSCPSLSNTSDYGVRSICKWLCEYQGAKLRRSNHL